MTSTPHDPDAGKTELGEPVSECLVPDSCTWPIVLGVDPGTHVMGYGALVMAPDGPRLLIAGVLRAKRSDTVFERLATLSIAFDKILRQTRPTTVVIENAFAHKNPRTTIRLGEARGVVIAAAARKGAAIEEISPAEAKKRITGNGNAAKSQVAAMVPLLLNLTGALDLADDATDALALALAFVRRDEVTRLLR
ncbi:MAG: crossover junction endodeoxyribonuclease RuvC [Planctomycetes bacterium]|nr:crossover junction endodeoxyribonuclease RuvC [Planctomycetota bacterium]